MRILVAAITAVFVAAALFLARPTQTAEQSNLKRYWVKVLFGTDKQKADWDGHLEIDNGRVHDMVGFCLERWDRLHPKQRSWKMHTAVKNTSRGVSYAEPIRGFLAEIETTGKTTVRIKTKQGNFSFKPAELTAGRPTNVLDGRASVQPLGTATLVDASNTDDDFASIAVDDKGHRHVLWIAYDDKRKRNDLLTRDVDDPKSQPERIDNAKEFSTPHLFFVDGEGLRAVWSSPGQNGDWDVYTATKGKHGWRTKQITTANGSDFYLAAAQAVDGTLWLAWQTLRNGNSDIYAQRIRKGSWLRKDVPVATAGASEWQPAVTVDPQGKAWIGYDTYENGNYDVYLTSVSCRNDFCQVGKRIPVARSTDFEAHASVLADGDRVWVAFDAAGPNWGRDFHNVRTTVNGQYSEPLHASRRVELRCVKNGQVYRPSKRIPQILPVDRIQTITRRPTSKPSRFYEFPQLARDGFGRVWVFFRQCRQGYCAHPPMGIDWRIYATTYTDKGWLEPIQLPKSQGRQDQRLSFTVGPDKHLHAAWADGNRFASVNRKYGVYYGRLPDVHEPQAPIPLRKKTIDRPGTPEHAPKVPWTLKRDREEYKLYFGDLHRHTNISRCAPTVDGCLIDAHRYAIDAAELDFLAITDHTRDVDPFSWWRTQQAADQFHTPKQYIPIYAYERSNSTKWGGHRNVFFLKRGAKINPSDHWYTGRNLPVKNTNPNETLYPFLKKQRGEALTAAHTPAYARRAKSGTWTFNDPQVEPVAEVFQAFRRSYIRPERGLAEEASVWFALRKGYKLGFIASSDHISTHAAYACVWANNKSRKAIFDAIQARRTYAANDRIALDFRIGDALMGEETKINDKGVRMSIRALGTAPINEVQIVRSGEVIKTLRPNKRDITLRFEDDQPLAGRSYYYARLRQTNGGIAWGSPIWVQR